MGRILVVANQTLGGAKLDTIIRDRIEAPRLDAVPVQFHVVVPLVEPEMEVGYLPADPGFAVPQPTGEPEGLSPMEEAQERSRHRLERMLTRIRSLGGEADGEVGPSDVVAATLDAVERVAPDEIIVSTLPAGVSSWLKMDVPSRLQRKLEIPMTVVEVEDQRARSA